MKILIEMTPENYDRFLSKLSKASAIEIASKNVHKQDGAFVGKKQDNAGLAISQGP
jgi:hypothetical protein